MVIAMKCFSLYSTIADVVKRLMSGVDEDNVFDMVIRRSHILSDALRRMTKQSFDPSKKIKVYYCGKSVIDK